LGTGDQALAVYAVAVAGRDLLVASGSDLTVRIWDPATGDLVRVLMRVERSLQSFAATSFVPASCVPSEGARDGDPVFAGDAAGLLVRFYALGPAHRREPRGACGGLAGASAGR